MKLEHQWVSEPRFWMLLVGSTGGMFIFARLVGGCSNMDFIRFVFIRDSRFASFEDIRRTSLTVFLLVYSGHEGAANRLIEMLTKPFVAFFKKKKIRFDHQISLILELW